MKTKSPLLTLKNKVIFILTYVIVATYLSLHILDQANEAARTIEDQIILMVVNLLVAAPGLAVSLLIVVLRTEYLKQTKDLLDFLSPPKGSRGNPTIDDIVGKKGLSFLNNLVIVLIIISAALFGWIAYSMLMQIK